MSAPLPALLLGAGFSAPVGVPTMQPFFEGFLALAQRRYTHLQVVLAEIIRQTGDQTDLEGLLSTLNRASEAQLAVPGSLAAGLQDWTTAVQELRAHLLAYVVEKCEQFDRENAARLYGKLISGLASRKVPIFTTNYDRVIEHVAEVLNLAVADGFERSPGQLVSPWSGDLSTACPLIKLHGSVTWYVSEDESRQRLRLDRGYPLPGPDFHLARSGKALRPLMILPTLEKNLLAEPYGWLSTFFSDTLRESNLLVVLGNSLRDEHLVSAITYRASTLVVLIVGHHPAAGAARLRGTTVVMLEADLETFLTVSTQSLLELIDRASSVLTRPELEEIVREFSQKQHQDISEWASLTEEQHKAVAALETGAASDRLDALSVLRGAGHPAVIRVLLQLLDFDDPHVRSAAAGALGLAKSVGAISPLLRRAREDHDQLVRVEAALALKEIGGPIGEQALEELKQEPSLGPLLQDVLRTNHDQGQTPTPTI